MRSSKVQHREHKCLKPDVSELLPSELKDDPSYRQSVRPRIGEGFITLRKRGLSRKGEGLLQGDTTLPRARRALDPPDLLRVLALGGPNVPRSTLLTHLMSDLSPHPQGEKEK